MRRFTTVLSLFVFPLFLSILFMPRAAACPVREPIPLRGLYLNSDTVIVGKIGEPEKWALASEMNEPGNRYRIYARNIPVTIDEVIKGSGDSVVAVRETHYQWLGNDVNANTDDFGANINKSGESAVYSSTLSTDKERRLFFLNKEADNGSFTETYLGRELSLPQKELDVYIARLRELANIYSSGTPSKERVMEWLVTMAEDPVTRFEGAYELRAALAQFTLAAEDEALAAEEEAAEKAAEKAEAEAAEAEAKAAQQTDAAEGADAADVAEAAKAPKLADPDKEAEAVNETKTGEAVKAVDAEKAEETAQDAKTENTDIQLVDLNDGVNKSQADLISYSTYGTYDKFAGLLTPDQKERLIRAALDLRFNYQPDKDEKKAESEKGDDDEENAEGNEEEEYIEIMGESDRMLLEVASYLGDRRIADRLLAEMPNVVKHNHDEVAAEMMTFMARYYHDEKLDNLVYKYSEISWNEDDALIEDEAQAYDQPEEETVIGKPDTAPDSKVRPQNPQAQKIPQPQKTYGQRRAELFNEIIMRTNGLVLTAKKGK